MLHQLFGEKINLLLINCIAITLFHAQLGSTYSGAAASLVKSEGLQADICNPSVDGNFSQKATLCLHALHDTHRLANRILGDEKIYESLRNIMKFFERHKDDMYLWCIFKMRTLPIEISIKSYEEYINLIFNRETMPYECHSAIGEYSQLLRELYSVLEAHSINHLSKMAKMKMIDLPENFRYEDISLSEAYSLFLLKLFKLNANPIGWYIFEPSAPEDVIDIYKNANKGILERNSEFEDRLLMLTLGIRSPSMKVANQLLASFSPQRYNKLFHVFDVFNLRNYWASSERNSGITADKFIDKLKKMLLRPRKDRI